MNKLIGLTCRGETVRQFAAESALGGLELWGLEAQRRSFAEPATTGILHIKVIGALRALKLLLLGVR